MAPSIEKRIASSIGQEPGRIFYDKEFFFLGSPGGVRLSLKRLCDAGKIRRLLPGLYYNPRFSEFLNSELSPSPMDIAAALAAKFGWDIMPTGDTALNLLGLSTQVTGTLVFLSSGPYRTYNIGQLKLEFRHSASKNFTVNDMDGRLVVQALIALGRENVTDDIIKKIRDSLSDEKKRQIAESSGNVATWILEALKEITGR
jgi:hypothetical protein